jgi:hypothetical protein
LTVWAGAIPNFALPQFSEVRQSGVLRTPPRKFQISLI